VPGGRDYLVNIDLASPHDHLIPTHHSHEINFIIFIFIFPTGIFYSFALHIDGLMAAVDIEHALLAKTRRSLLP
jgi:hypothetical protein